MWGSRVVSPADGQQQEGSHQQVENSLTMNLAAKITRKEILGFLFRIIRAYWDRQKIQLFSSGRICLNRQ